MGRNFVKGEKGWRSTQQKERVARGAGRKRSLGVSYKNCFIKRPS